MRRPVEVKAHEDDGLPRPVLIGGLCKLDLSAGDVENEILALINGIKGSQAAITNAFPLLKNLLADRFCRLP